MQEEVEQRSLTLVINSGKMTGRVLKSAIVKLMAHNRQKAQGKGGDVRYVGKQTLRQLVGQNQGEKVPKELAALLQAKSRIASDFDVSRPDYDVDVLIIGGGGAGASAAIEADNAGAKAMIVTKLRIGDANTMMAEGGIQAADKENDSPAIHYVDAFGGGHFAAVPEL